MLLMDVGAEYHGYTADVTRTIPANGKFSAEEKLIYQIVYDAQEAAFKTLKNGSKWKDAEDAAQGYTVIGNYRKAGGDYHGYDDMGAYFGLDNAVNMDYIFLKDNVPAGTKWQTAPINGTFTDSSTGTVIPISLRIEYTIEQKDITATVGGISFPNTIVVTEKYQAFNGTDWQSFTELLGYYKSFYARGVPLPTSLTLFMPVVAKVPFAWKNIPLIVSE